MSTSKITLGGERAVTDHSTSLVLFLAQGIIGPQISTLAIDLYVGWMFLISGLIGLFTMFVASDATAFLWSLLIAGLSLITSGLAIVKVAAAARNMARMIEQATR